MVEKRIYMSHPSTSSASNYGDTDGHPDGMSYKVPVNRGKIRIIKTPRGPAPKSIRKKWIGVEIETVCYESKPPQYIVRQEHALAALAKKEPETAKWWAHMGFPQPHNDFAFRKDEAKEIEEVFPRL